MARVQYAGVGTLPPTISTIVGSVTSAASGSYSAYLQSRNRAGCSVFSPRVDFTVAPGEGVRVVIPAAIRQPAWDLHEVVLSIAKNSTNPLDATVVATYPGFELDGVTPRSLPAQIDLTQDEHLLTASTVTSRDALPRFPLHGMRRYLNDEAIVVAYDIFRDSWTTVIPAAFSTYVASSLLEGGSDRAVEDLNEVEVAAPSYDAEGGGSEPVKFWIVNDTPSPIPQGTRVRLAIDINGIDYSDRFAGLMQVTPLGYADPASGVISAIGGSGMALTYQGDKQTDLLLPSALPSGQAYAFSVQMAFAAYMLNNEVLQGNTIRIYPRFAAQFARYEEGGELLGNYILPKGKRRRIVPLVGLSALALEGSGRVGSYTFRGLGEQVVVGLAPNTANQKCIVTSNGSCFVSDTIPDMSALRCLIGTVAGEGKATDWSSAIALDTGKVLKVQVAYPNTVRADYPDAIRGSSDGQFNASRVYFYVKSYTSIQRFEGVVTLGNESDVFTVGAIAGTSVSSLPVVSDDFGLYAPTSFASSVEAGTSTFASGLYQIAIAFYYDGLTVTSISHDVSNGSIYESSGNLENLFAVRRSWGESVDIGQIRKVDVESWQTKKIIGSKDLIYFDPDSTDIDDGVNTWKPSIIELQSPGRWLLYKTSPDLSRSVAYLKLQLVNAPPLTGSGEVAIFADVSDGLVKVRAQNNGDIKILGTGSVDDVLLDENGNFLIDEQGNTLTI